LPYILELRKKKMYKCNVLLLFLVIYSCKVSNRPIDYGSDECEFCKMIVMDKRYGSELVTEKGKVYIFDSSECLIDYLFHNEETGIKAHSLLVTPYLNPDHLIDAKSATYLVCGQMPSPMGAYLTAFSDKETAKETQSSKGGYLFTWEELVTNFESIRVNAIKEFE